MAPKEKEEFDVSRLLCCLVLSASAFSAAAFSFAMRSASIAASSASGTSGIVSRDEMLGLRERILVGVDGMDEPDETDMPGKGSLYLIGSMTGEVEAGLLAMYPPAPAVLECNGEDGRRRTGRGKV